MSENNYILFLENLNEIDRSLRRTKDLDQTMIHVLDTMLSIFKSDRAWLLFPCNPDALSWGVPMERTRVGYPGALIGGKNIPMLPEAASVFRAALESDKPVTYDKSSHRALPPEASEQFQIRSQITTAVYPKIGEPWLLGMHQCSYSRIWSEDDQSLFHEIGRRIADTLSTLLLLKNLQESERKFRSIVESSSDLLWEVNKDGVYTYVSPKIKDMLGYEPEEIVGKTPFDFMDKGEANRVETLFNQAIQNRTAIEVLENSNRHKDGHTVVLETSGVPIIDADGTFQGFRGVDRDITERIKAENQLKESERTYREIFDGSNDALFIHDINTGRIIDANSKATELYGYKPSELIGMTVDLLSVGHPPYTVKQASEWIKKSIEEGPQIFEWMARNKEGEAFWVEVSLKKVSIAGKDRLMAVIRDIRHRKATDKELTEYREHLEKLVDRRAAEIKAKNKELEMFTYSVSHDLKAPLRGIDGYSRLLVEEYADKLDEEGLFFLNNVRQGTAQMNKLIEDLLAYSRMERKTLNMAAIDLDSLIENLVDQRTHDIEQCRIRVTVDLPFQTIESDTETLRQVLTNYLDNAIKYSKKDTPGTVTIGGCEDDDYWTVWVKDTGIGFDPKYLDRIFEIFQRLHRVEEYPGTGVGLAIVRKAVERIGGRVRAESLPGKGATFYLDIPKNKPLTS